MFVELARFPEVLYDNSWRLDVARALVRIRSGADLLESLATPAGASQIHGQMLLIAYDSGFFVENVAHGIDDEDAARIEAAAGDLSRIDRYITDLTRQLETFCA